ncbi:replication protein A 70 kDa DNA-binding subunit D-like isoform X1 [Tasmannia lanceolata]|uniref:replication protein A 70 kDa DNA-binding subunit D-like isoform X1 n=1 Tax=Tasmannia lanceolata TaxID=3420 RepID=UPI004063DC25
MYTCFNRSSFWAKKMPRGLLCIWGFMQDVSLLSESPFKQETLVKQETMLPKILELVGLGYTGWFVFRYLLFKRTQIRAALFTEAINLFADKLHIGRTYYISNALVKMSNAPYNSGSGKEIIFNKHTIVREAESEQQITETVNYKFVPLKMAEQYLGTNNYIDIIVIVVSMGPPLNTTRKRDGTTTTRRQLQIIDSGSTLPMQLTLWGGLATEEGEIIAEKVDENPVVIMTSIKVQQFQGTSFCTTGDTIIQIDSEIQEAKVLKEWASTHPLLVEMHKEQQKSQIPSIRRASTPTNINAIINGTLLDKQVQLYKVHAWIIEINNRQDPWYPACTVCKKKLEKFINAEKCEHCFAKKFEVTDRYLLRIKIGDKTGTFWISVFDKQVEKILGCEAYELKKMKETDSINFINRVEKCLWTSYAFTIKISERQVKDESSRQYTCVDIEEIDDEEWKKPPAEIAALLPDN